MGKSSARAGARRLRQLEKQGQIFFPRELQHEMAQRRRAQLQRAMASTCPLAERHHRRLINGLRPPAASGNKSAPATVRSGSDCWERSACPAPGAENERPPAGARTESRPSAARAEGSIASTAPRCSKAPNRSSLTAPANSSRSEARKEKTSADDAAGLTRPRLHRMRHGRGRSVQPARCSACAAS